MYSSHYFRSFYISGYFLPSAPVCNAVLTTLYIIYIINVYLFQPSKSSFWEDDVPEMNEEAFKETFGINRRSFGILCRSLKPRDDNENHPFKDMPLEKRIAVAIYTLRTTNKYSIIARLFNLSSSARLMKLLMLILEWIERTVALKHMSPIYSDLDAFGLPQCFGAIGKTHSIFF